MSKTKVAVVSYERPLESVRRAVELCGGLDRLPAKARVYLKPNLVFWTRLVPFPKWGVITTSRVLQDLVVLLKERGIDDITIAEGITGSRARDVETAAHAFETLGYGVLRKRYGVKVLNVFEKPFEKMDLGEGVALHFNPDVLGGDFVVNVPVLKTHAQTMVSLGLKNLKGLINIRSRQQCHGADPVKDLNYMVARLANRLPPSMTVLDGIYTTERGPLFDGRIRRSNLLVASADLLSADLVGARVLGFDPSEVPHLALAARERNRPADLSDVEIVGKGIDEVASPHEWTFPYTEDGTLPLPMAKMGIKGISYPKYDLTMCTYCSLLTGVVLTAIAQAWKGEPWDDVEVLTGKVMEPTPGKKTTILLGKCMFRKNKDNPHIRRSIAVKGCPPSSKGVVKAFQEAGVALNPAFFESIETAAGFFLKKYEGKPEFDEAFFRVA